MEKRIAVDASVLGVLEIGSSFSLPFILLSHHFVIVRSVSVSSRTMSEVAEPRSLPPMFSEREAGTGGKQDKKEGATHPPYPSPLYFTCPRN